MTDDLSPEIKVVSDLGYLPTTATVPSETIARAMMHARVLGTWVN